MSCVFVMTPIENLICPSKVVGIDLTGYESNEPRDGCGYSVADYIGNAN